MASTSSTTRVSASRCSVVLIVSDRADVVDCTAARSAVDRRIAELHAAGGGYRAIAREVNLGATTVARRVKDMNLAPHRPGRAPTLPQPGPRQCALDGCTNVFTPRARQ